MSRSATRALMTVMTVGVLTCASALAANHRVISEKTVRIPVPYGNYVKTDTVVQEGLTRLNRFTMHRLSRENGPNKGTILLLPPLGNNFNSYLMHPSDDIVRSFAGHLVRAGFEVWGYSPRETGIQTGDCGNGLDCSPALTWGIETVVSDVQYIRSRIESVSPGKLPVIGGLSLGAITALATINQAPSQYAGLLAWEGSIATADIAVRAHNSVYCDQFRGLVTAGVPVDDQNLPFVKLVANLASSAPGAPFALPVPGFPPGLTNLQAFVLILSTPNPIAPSPRPGFISAAGDFMAGTLTFSEPSRLAANIAEFNDVTFNAVSRDMYCSLAGKLPKLSDNLAKFTGPVLVVKAGQGFGSLMDELPGMLGSTDVTLIEDNSFGHVDHLGAVNHVAVLEAPVAKWLARVYR